MKKQLFAVPYIKYGFYLARAWLKSKKPGESFPELQYTVEASIFPALEWSNFEMVVETIEEALERAAHDDLSNLAGPWEPRVPYISSGPRIGALDDLNEDLGDDFTLDMDGIVPSSDVPLPPPDHATASTPVVDPATALVVTEDAAAAAPATAVVPPEEAIEID